MEWTEYSKKKPENSRLCYVTNTKKGPYCFIAIYYSENDTFEEYATDRSYPQRPALEITHWVELPHPPLTNKKSN